MPFINLKLIGKLTKDQKQEIAKGFTGTLKRVANKSPESAYIVFDEVDGENWAKGDKLYG